MLSDDNEFDDFLKPQKHLYYLVKKFLQYRV